MVLVVEADANSSARLARFLEDEGHATEVVTSAAEALVFLSEHEDCELVISETNLQPNSGFALLGCIVREHPGVAVILMSERQEIALVRKAFRLGASDLLRKPLCRGSALLAVDRALEQGRLRQQTLAYWQNLEQMVCQRGEQLHTLMTDLELSCEVTIEAMGALLDLRDEETEGHSRRVTAYTYALANAMGLRPNELKTAVRGAFLHDIGKIAVPDAILLKPGPLTPDEMEIMQRHCHHGYSIVGKIPSLAEAAEIVYAHQEAYDGSGYPRGLRGEEIPLGARIFAIADTLDAITSDRPYRKASSFAFAIAEIERHSGKQFDPAVVKAFKAIPCETWSMLRAETGRHCRELEMVRAPGGSRQSSAASVRPTVA
jgi:response regulator RpfG family c-di-GMP phosphodiesterase